MIYDHISNLERYRTLDPLVYQALVAIRDRAGQLALGKHVLAADGTLSDSEAAPGKCVTLGVDDYFTKLENPVGYETHVKYIDVQYLVRGTERVKVRMADTMTVTVPYCEQRDAAFYADDRQPAVELTLGGGMFAIFYPTDAHQPQLVDGCCPVSVRKIVAKVPVAR